jgi:hypothetical protein
MSGTAETRGEAEAPDRPPAIGDDGLATLWRVLNREIQIDSLQELRNGLQRESRRPKALESSRIAFGFDTNAIYRVGLDGTRGVDAVDYIRQRHNAPIIVPGQAVQELWNNILWGVERPAERLQKRLDDLSSAANEAGQNLGESGERVNNAINDLIRIHGEWIAPASQEILEYTLDALIAAGRIAYVPRYDFYRLARIRKETKTPPGYKDSLSNHGDFYLWADFLYGLVTANLSEVDAAVLVTNDVKPDWSRSGVAHPILVAEAMSAGGLPFQLWTVRDFHEYVKRA